MERIRGTKIALLVQDTTEIDLSRPESIHKELTPKEKDKTRRNLPIQQKESFRWREGWR